MEKSLPLLLAIALATAHAEAQSIVDVVVASDAHETLEELVLLAGLDDDLAADGPFTLFAPDDDAFAALEAAAPGTLADLRADTAQLAAILRYHVLGQELAAADIPSGQSYVNSLNRRLSVQVVNEGSVVLNGDATVETADIPATNGVVHSISQVILPLTVLDAVEASPAHSTLEQALEAGGYRNALARTDLAPDTYVLWAPDDDAFASLDPATLTDLLTNPDSRQTLAAILQYHVLLLNTGGAPFTTSLISDQLLFPSTLSLSGDDFGFVQQVMGDGTGGVTVNNVTPDIFDIRCTNGVVYSIGEVLSPPTTSEFVGISALHETLATALEATGLDDVLADEDAEFTLFAPTDAAFTSTFSVEEIGALVEAPDQLRPTLLYHAFDTAIASDAIPDGLSFADAISGETLQFVGETDDDDNRIGTTVDNLPLETVDLRTTNGVIHVIDDGVLLRPDVVAVAQRSPIHATLVSLLTQAALDGTLQDTAADYTVFAPTDDAFAAVPQSTLDSIVAAGLLDDVLTYHVLPMELSAEAIIRGGSTAATTVQGENIAIVVGGDGIVLNGAVAVTATDVFATNGVVHVIDGVLLPPALFSNVTATAAEAGITVGPIPADDHTVVTLPSAFADGARIEIFDVTGQLIRTQPLTSTRERIELGELSAGTYFMTFDVAGERYLQPLIVK